VFANKEKVNNKRQLVQKTMSGDDIRAKHLWKQRGSAILNNNNSWMVLDGSNAKDLS